MSGPAFDEPICPICRTTRIGLRDDEPCKSQACHAKPRVKRYLTDADPQWLRELKTGNPGETHGMEGREAAHAYMTRISKEKGRDE